MILAIDLAERHSAACLMDAGGAVLHQSAVDVGPASAMWQTRLSGLESWWDELYEHVRKRPRPHAWIEDIHPFAVNPKPGLRLQGALLMLMTQHAMTFEFVSASKWQRGLGYKRVRGTSSNGWAKAKAAELGHEPPPGTSGKALQDLRDAFLIATYVRLSDGA